MTDTFMPASKLLRGYSSRAATFENPTGSPSSGGTAAGGRKGAPWKLIRPGETVTLASFDGSGSITHFWMTLSQRGTPAPEFLRSQVLEITYSEVGRPSVSVPIGDYFGAVHGVVAPYASALTAMNEGRGYSSRVPVPFREGITVTYTNNGETPGILYYQIDVLLGPQPDDTGYLHATFRRENPTTLERDFVVWEGLEGPGRFLGWTGGVRVFDRRWWWGEGEMKFYFDGEDLPTICGTGTEDYLDSGWGLGTYYAPETGAPLVTSVDGPSDDSKHELISFYRWHLSDPVVFDTSLRATIQQIGAAGFAKGDEDAYNEFKSSVKVAGNGWFEDRLPGMAGFGLFERTDDWCATAFVYLADPQAVPSLDVSEAARDLAVPSGQFVRREMPRPGAGMT